MGDAISDFTLPSWERSTSSNKDRSVSHWISVRIRASRLALQLPPRPRVINEACQRKAGPGRGNTPGADMSPRGQPTTQALPHTAIPCQGLSSQQYRQYGPCALNEPCAVAGVAQARATYKPEPDTAFVQIFPYVAILHIKDPARKKSQSLPRQQQYQYHHHLLVHLWIETKRD